MRAVTRPSSRNAGLRVASTSMGRTGPRTDVSTEHRHRQIRLTDELRALFTEQAPPGWLTMWAAMKVMGVSRQTVLQRVKRGQLRAVHVHRGRQPGLRIEVPATT